MAEGDKMENLMLIFLILTLSCSIGVHGGAIPVNDIKGRRVQKLSSGSFGQEQQSAIDVIGKAGGSFGGRGAPGNFLSSSGQELHQEETLIGGSMGVSDMPARTSYLNRRDELMERLRLELQEWHDIRQGYVNPGRVGGKSLLSTVSSIVSLVNTLLPWFGIRPPQPMMSSGRGMMSSSGGMMSNSGGMMSSTGQMMSGGGSTMAGNIVLGPLPPYDSGVLVPYTHFWEGYGG